MLSEREKEAVKGFRVWAKALKDDDVAAMRKIERAWNAQRGED